MELDIAGRIRAKMEAKNLKPRSLSLLARLGDTAARDVLNGRSVIPRLKTLEAFAKALECPVSEIVSLEEVTEVLTKPASLTARQKGNLETLKDDLERSRGLRAAISRAERALESLQSDRLDLDERVIARGLAALKSRGFIGGGPDFSAAILVGADLSGGKLAGANFMNADLSSADLSGADLTRASFRGANLTGASLVGATLQGADFTDAILRDTKFI